jgi:ubiquinone/menaquinone biosynthesis C-methylase UbiE
MAARWYDVVFEPLNRKLKAIALRMAPPRAGQRVLDVGCGTGATLELYRAAGCELWGLDASPAMLEVAARRLGSSADLRTGDATAMPYDDHFFHWVVLTLVLHEMAPTVRAATLAEAARVVATDGRVLVVDYAAASRRRLRGLPLTALITFVERAAGGDHWRGFRHFVTHGAAAASGRSAGLEVEVERQLGHGNLAVTVLRPGA